MISRAGFSHHRLDRLIPGFRSSAKHKSMIGQVAIYFVTVFCWRAIYTLISSSPNIASAAPIGGYTHVLSRWRLGTMPAIRRAAPLSGETPRGISPTGGSGPTSWTQTVPPISPPPYRTSSPLSYMLPTLPRSSPEFPIFPVSAGGSIPPPANHRRWTTAFVPSTGMKRPMSAVSHTPRSPAPSAPQSPQPPTSLASSPS